jgi:hypothetical protein
LGQLAFTLPSDAKGLAAALTAPELTSLLSAEVQFESSFNLWFDIGFLAAVPPLQKRFTLADAFAAVAAQRRSADELAAPAPAARRQLLQGPAAPATQLAPAALLAGFQALLSSSAAAAGDAAAGAKIAELFLSLSGIEYEQLSFQVITGVAAIEALRVDTQPALTAQGACVLSALARLRVADELALLLAADAQAFTVFRCALSAGTRASARLVRA